MKEFDAKVIVVKMLDGTVVKGKTNLKNNTRLSDLLNEDSSPFLVVFDAFFQGEPGRVVFINKKAISWAMPMDNVVRKDAAKELSLSEKDADWSLSLEES